MVILFHSRLTTSKPTSGPHRPPAFGMLTTDGMSTMLQQQSRAPGDAPSHPPPELFHVAQLAALAPPPCSRSRSITNVTCIVQQLVIKASKALVESWIHVLIMSALREGVVTAALLLQTQISVYIFSSITERTVRLSHVMQLRKR